MARNDPQMNLRVPMELKEKIEKAAFQNGRTITAEAIQRLERSFENNISDSMVLKYMKAVEEKNVLAQRQLDISNMLMVELAEKLPDTDPIKIKVLEMLKSSEN